MKKEKYILIYTIATFLLLVLNSHCTRTEPLGEIKRTELQRYDLDIPAREVIQTRIDFDEGTTFGKHSHPGEEIIYVIEGLLEYQVEGRTPVTLKKGEVLFIPTGIVHAARNVGKGKASELATYIVEKGKPLLVIRELFQSGSTANFKD